MTDFLREIKACIAFQCYATMQKSPGTLPQQHEMMYKLYHGDGVKIAYVDRFVRGIDKYSTNYLTTKGARGGSFLNFAVARRHTNQPK